MGAVINLSGSAFAAHIEREWIAAPYNLAKGLENFKVWVARTGREIFTKSFEIERFYSAGSQAWPKLSPSRIAARKSAHPILTDTGRLKRSIVYRIAGKANVKQFDKGYWANSFERTFTTNRMLLKYNKGSLTQIRERRMPQANSENYARSTQVAATYGSTGKVVIYTNPAAFKGTRSGVCYAAVHNEGSEGGYTFGTKAPAVKRQFMGHSTYMSVAIQNYSKEFVGFNLPGVR